MRKRIFIGSFVAVSLILAAGVAPAMADTVGAPVTGGTLTETTSGATLTGVTLDGKTTQTATGTASSAWSVTDARGTGAAWAVSVTATTPTSAAGTAPSESTARTIAVDNLTITPGTITAATGADAVGNTLTAPALAMSGASQALISSTGSNKGTYSLTPTFSLAIPANSYRSNWSGAVDTSTLNPYVSTLTYTIG